MKHRLVLLAGLVAGALPCAASAQAKFDGYLCCNMRSDGSWISDGNYAEDGKRTLPAGTPAKVTGYGRYRVRVELDGSKQAIGNDYSRYLAPEDFARRYVVSENPADRIASWPAKVQDAVRQSKVTAGMDRDQVLVSLGYPMHSENPDLDAPLWRYWLSSFDEFQVQFDDSGRVSDVTAMPTTRNRIWMP